MSSTASSSSQSTIASTSTPSASASTLPTPACRCWPRRRRPPSWPSTSSRSATAPCWTSRSPSVVACWSEALRPGPQVHLTPVTADRDEAAEWFRTVEGAGLDGLIAKDPAGVYEPDKRVLRKVKHKRTADCVAAGFRWHKDGEGIGSIILGIHGPDGDLRHVGVAASFTAKFRRELVDELTPLVADDLSDHPWGSWMEADAHRAGGGDGQMPGAPSRWNNQRDQSWTPLRIERVVEVGYTIMTSGRFRGTTRFVRWRPDKTPAECTYDQLDVVPPMGFRALVTSIDRTVILSSATSGRAVAPFVPVS